MAWVYKKGTILLNGATSEIEARTGARRIGRLLHRVGIPNIRFQQYKVTNMLAVCKLPFNISLEKFYDKFHKELSPKELEYVPEVNPGITFRIAELKATLKVDQGIGEDLRV
jgi:TATA-box binding protein (TBP) (component of TFIID and TFIIIB)